MKYNDFECVFSRERLRKYVLACKNNKRKALNLLIMSLFTLDHIHIPNKPKSTSTNNYNNSFVFSELDMINDIRNRIAHHESICFKYPYSIDLIMFFEWMQISHKRLLCGFDHIDEIAEKIKKISEN